VRHLLLQTIEPLVLLNLKQVLYLKLSIVLEEVDESYFWLEFIIDEKLLKSELVQPLLTEAK
jgi:hypothetical protein